MQGSCERKNHIQMQAITIEQRLTSFSDEREARVIRSKLAAVGLDMQNDGKGLSPPNDQTLLSKEVGVVAAAVLLYVQITALDVKSCVHRWKCSYHSSEETRCHRKI